MDAQKQGNGSTTTHTEHKGEGSRPSSARWELGVKNRMALFRRESVIELGRWKGEETYECMLPREGTNSSQISRSARQSVCLSWDHGVLPRKGDRRAGGRMAGRTEHECSHTSLLFLLPPSGGVFPTVPPTQVGPVWGPQGL